MKKRAFLAPLAISVAALLSASPSDASIDQKVSAEVAREASGKAGVAEAMEELLVLERNDGTAIQTAYHYSHRSHYSHQSHRSHYTHQSHYSSY